MNVNKFIRSELTVKTLALPKHEKIKLLSQTKEKHDSLVLSRSNIWMVWRWNGILRVHCYYFCLEPKVRKENLNKNDFRHGYDMFFESRILKVSLSQISSKSLLNIYDVRWKQHFERYPTVLYFTDMEHVHVKSFIKTLLNITK